MPNHTTNYNLIKPLPDEFYDVDDQNSNMDIIDTNLAGVQQQLTEHLDNEYAHGLNKYYSLERAQTIPHYTDLNDLKILGNYISNSGTATATLLNCPVTTDSGFAMKIERVTGDSVNFLRQTIKVNHQIPKTYKRTMINNVFSPWHETILTRGLTWIEATPQNGWQQVTESTVRLRYAKDDFGFVHLIGELNGGVATDGTIITSLPVGFRPSFSTPITTVKANDATLFVTQVNNLGNVTVFGLNATGRIRLNGSFYVGV